MSQERFKEVEKIFDQVLNVSPRDRSKVLKESCGDDIELRKEIESLLALENSSDHRIDGSPGSLIAEVFSQNNTDQFIGTKINQYKVLSLLGKGGMGSVYLAQDSILGRKVSVKLMSRDFISGMDKAGRFFQEAKAASALNHPNILTVHEIGEIDGTQYIVAEYVDGKTLKEHLYEKGHSIRSLLEIALQIASALDAAHRAGIIHRDIKPDNIMIRADGVVKVLDFGLAKLGNSQDSLDIDSESETVIRHETMEGMIIGTPQYMSPEQARGQKVDARSDIFSFGIVLYEMISGRVPFSGVNEIDTIGSILKDEPKLLREFVPVIEPDLEHIVSKALRKDRESRYQNSSEIISELKIVRDAILPQLRSSTPTKLHSRPNTLQTSGRIVTERRFSLLQALLFVTVLLGGLATLWWVYFSPKTLVTNNAPYRSTLIASWNSSPGEVYTVGSFSSDGKMVAFSSTKSRDKNVWIKQTKSGEALQITRDEFINEYPIWSPTDEELAFLSTRGNIAGIWRIPVFGGEPILVTTLDDGGANLIAWSKSGLIYYESHNELFSVDLATGKSMQVSNFRSNSLLVKSVSISRDEKHIAFVTMDGEESSIWSIPFGSDGAKKLYSEKTEFKNTAWAPDNKSVYYSANIGGIFQIFATDIDGKAPRQITFSDSDCFVLEITSNGEKLLYGSAKEESDIWSFGLNNSKESVVVSELASELWGEVSPDGKTIAYQSINNLSQGNNLLSGKILAKKLEPGEATTEVAEMGALPVWSPDGKQVAYFDNEGMEFNIFTSNVENPGLKRMVAKNVSPLTNSILPYNRLQTNYFSWSPGSQQIAFISSKSGAPNVWLVGNDGSNEVQLTANTDANLYFYCPMWSSDGEKVAFTARSAGVSATSSSTYQVLLVEIDTKIQHLMTQEDDFYRLLSWNAKNNELLAVTISGSPFISIASSVSLVSIDSNTGAKRRSTVLKDAYLYNIHSSPDGKSIAFVANRERVDNLWLVPTAGGAEKKLTDNNDSRVYFSSLAWTNDSSSIFFGKQTRYSLLSMLTNFN